MALKEKDVYVLHHTATISVARYTIKYKNEQDLENQIAHIEDGTTPLSDDIFEYTPQNVAAKLDCDMSRVYEDDVEDEKKLEENIIAWIDN